MPKRRAFDEDELEPWERPRQWKRTKPAEEEHDEVEEDPEDYEEDEEDEEDVPRPVQRGVGAAPGRASSASSGAREPEHGAADALNAKKKARKAAKRAAAKEKKQRLVLLRQQ